MRRISFSAAFRVMVWVLTGLGLAGCSKNYDWSHSKSEWMEAYFAEIRSGAWPRIHAVSWWNENFDDTYLKINSSDRSLETYRELVSDDLFVTSCIFSGQKLVPDPGKVYHSAFPDFGGTEDIVTTEAITLFEEQCGKQIAWAFFSNNWLDTLVFPSGAVEVIKNAGRTPFVRLMFRSSFEESVQDPVLRLSDIITGRYDAALAAWADGAKECGTNLLAEFGTEMNGSWFPWNGIWCGGGTTGSYGDPFWPDGPELFRDAYIRIIEICRMRGADNVTWFFHFDVNSEPDEWWNDPVYYYPGDAYIDWLGVSTYGPFGRGDEYVEPADMLSKACAKMDELSPGKPCAVLEFGITEL